MELIPVIDSRFSPYGRIVRDFECSDLLLAMESTPVPQEGTIYKPSEIRLEKLPVFSELERRAFGGMPIQLGYCNGRNNTLNALEYHASSEFNLACTDVILLLGLRQEIDATTYIYDTAQVKAFLVPQGMMLEIYATTLHYAPCGVDGAGFRFMVALPEGTNLPLTQPVFRNGGEDRLLTARNKWLLAHPESPEALAGAYAGLKGVNLKV